MSFALDVSKFVEKAKKNPEKVMRQVSIKLFSAIIKASPVDTGRFRMNWMASGGTPASGITDATDKSGNTATGNATSFVLKATDWHEFTLTNNLPYAQRLECCRGCSRGHTADHAPRFCADSHRHRRGGRRC